MRIHFLQHVPFEGPGHIEQWAWANKVQMGRTALFLGEDFPSQDAFDVLVIMGGPMGVLDEEKYAWLRPEKEFINGVISVGKAVLGICLGAQLIAEVLGAKVYANPYQEIGWYPVDKSKAIRSTPMEAILPSRFMAFHWHGDTFDVPSGAIPVGQSEACHNQGFVYHGRVVAFQFHLESTRESIEALIANCRDELSPGRFIQSAETIKRSHRLTAESNSIMDDVMDLLGNRKTLK